MAMKVRKTQVEGTVGRTIQTVYERYQDDPGFRNAKLDEFEELAGVSPPEAIDAIVKGAAEKCRVKDCGLTVQVQDQVHDRGGGGVPPNEIEATKERDVTATVTCPRSCSREACESVITRVTGTIDALLDEVTGDVVGAAQRAHMEPAQHAAGTIRADADAEAESILAAARGGLEDVGAQAITDFRERYDLLPPVVD